ncbi:hypothetical protein PHISP_04823 [Aspergillus sp. HF37]|nr:hypothetical protein PHISP_04823 [Aspergillus sp. HF37]
MSLQDVYRRFLADPKSAALAPDISLLYVTTTTRFDQADAVLTHLSRQQKIVEKKSNEVISAIEGPGSLCLDVETTLEFLTGGGAYLPSMDDNFLADRVATFPTVHIVRFNAQNQIQQVKLYWDQGSLLKQIEVIGSRGRNWPIRDATEQTRFIKSGILSTPADTAPAPTPFLPANADKPSDENERPSSPGKRRIKDPYAADSLVDLLSPGKDRVESVHTPLAPATGQPPPRDIGELFVAHDDDTPEPSPTRKPIAPKAGAGRSYQPSRIFNDNDETAEAAQPAKTVAPKAGAGRNYQPSRIFNDSDETAEAAQPAKTVAPKAGAGHKFRPSRIFDDDETVAAEEGKRPSTYRTNPNRFSHFEIGGDNSEREAKPIPMRPKSQHMAQWKFDDFVTPEKPVRKPHGQEIRHFGWSDDEVDGTPPAKPHVPQPRRDAQTHIQLADEIDDQNDNNSTAARAHRSKASSVSQNPLYQDGDDGDAPNEPDNNSKAPPLSVVANGANRKKDFDTHWNISDASPADESANTENRKPVGTDRLKAVQMMAPSWENYDESPQRPKAPAPRRAARSAIDRHWGFDDM